jgi:HAE1 family hydrophobic/amphiphilic exporter-1
MRSFFLITLALCASAADLPTIARVGVSVTEKKLTLAEAIEMALANNLDIEIERTNRDQAETAVRIAQGAFDPRLQFQPGYAANNTPTGSVLQGVDGKLSEDTSTENFYYRQKLPWWGSSFEVDFTNGRTSTTNLFSSLNPYFNSQLLVNFTLPLLRNREIDQDRANISIRRKQRDVSQKDFEIRVIDIVTTVQQAYWDLVAAREDVDVQADAVELAAQQLAQNQRMIRSGTLAPIELSASEAELDRRKDTYYSSVGTLTEAENNLKTMLLPGRHSETWSDQLVPVDTNTAEPPATDDVREAVADALKRRPEMRQVALRKDANQIDRQLNSNQIKPQINLVGSYTSTGLGGALSSAENPFDSFQPIYDRINQLSAAAGLPPVAESSLGNLPGSLIGGYGATLAGIFGGSYQSVQVGLQLDFTARNRAARGNYTNTLIEAKRLKFEQSRTEQLIESQVRNALQAIQTARQRIVSAETGERAAREKLESETRLFQTGESTNFFVLTRQNEYLDARRRAVLAHLDFNKAVARLEQAAGNTLPNHGVTLR